MLRARALPAVLLALAVLAAGGSPARASAERYPLNPPANIPVPSYVFTGACHTAPTSAGCTAVLVQALNDARAAMGEPDYHLPPQFAGLTAPERLLVIADQDRILYGRTRLSGLNATLNASAHDGIVHDRDPSFVNLPGNTHYVGAAANWAGGSSPMSNPLYAYYLWMYDDGPGSGNIDCRKPSDPGCWGHRDGTLLNFGTGVRVLLGVGGGTSRFGYGWTELFEAFRTTAVTPLFADITRLDKHTATPGATLQVSGYGLLHAGTAYVLGHPATILSRTQYRLVIRVPAGSGSGYVGVHGDGGQSTRSPACAFSYA